MREWIEKSSKETDEIFNQKEGGLVASKNIYEKIINAFPDGFAFFKVVKDHREQPVDLVTLGINQSFRSIMGFDNAMIGRNISEFISTSDPQVSSWIKIFADVAANGKSTLLEHYAKEMKRWFLVAVFSFEIDCFAITLQDITANKVSESEKGKLKDEYEAVFNNTQDAMFLIDVDPDNHITYCRLNQSHEKATGLTTEEVAGKTPQELFGEEMGAALEANYLQCITGKVPITYEEKLTLVAGTKVWLTMLSPVLKDGKVIQVIGAARDITIRKKAEEQLFEEKEKLDITLESIGDGVITTDTDGKIVLMNTAAEVITGHKEINNSGKNIEEVLKLQSENSNSSLQVSINNIMAAGQTTQIFNDVTLLTRNGEKKRISGSGAPIRDVNRSIRGIVLTFRDETEKLKNKEQLLYLSFHDGLTGLYNRVYFDDELKRLDTQRQLPLSVIVGDVNGLKLSNDVFGHVEGDHLLTTIARIMKESCRYEDVIARWGGDEFAIILPGTCFEDAMLVCKRIKEKCEEQEPVPIKPSIALGAATKTEEGQNISKVLTDAEESMYRNKLTEGRKVRSDIISSLQKRLQEKNNETIEHCERMQDFAKVVRNHIFMSDTDFEALRLLVVLHDIGNIAIPKQILQKPGILNDEEWVEIKKHPEIGFRVAQLSPELAHIAEAILSHHERWDGTGYPEGLKEEKIPMLSRILSLMDAYDVMIHDKSYRKAISHKEAVEEIRRCSGTQFDPIVADLFIRAVEEAHSKKA